MSPGRPDATEQAEALTFDAADSRFTRLVLGGGPFYEKLASVLYADDAFQY
jgi:hypothetical protein